MMGSGAGGLGCRLAAEALSWVARLGGEGVRGGNSTRDASCGLVVVVCAGARDCSCGSVLL